MKIAYVSILPANDPRSWSGLNLHIAACLQAQGCEVEFIGPLYNAALTAWSKGQSALRQTFLRKRSLWTRNTTLLRHYAKKTTERIAGGHYDLLLSPGTEPIAYLPEDVRIPVAFWTDAPFGAMLDYYPWYQRLDPQSVHESSECDRLALQRAALAIYSSEWAARAAVEKHGADPARVAVVPFGANMESCVGAAEVETLVARRLQAPWRFLFVGVEWERKGGDLVLATIKELNARGYPSELIVVGCEPPARARPLPSFVKVEGFMDKRSEAGRKRLAELYRSTLFFLMPSRAEAFGVVFCEASAHAVPSLATATGGIPTIIHDGENGQTFPLGARAEDYVEYIVATAREDRYSALAGTTLKAFEQRLNWGVSGERAMGLLSQVCGAPPPAGSSPAKSENANPPVAATAALISKRT